MQYSPKLKTAMEEIKAVIKKHDLAALVVLHTPGFSEYLFKIDPTYSAAKIEGVGIKIKVKAEHYDGDKKKRDQAVADTANLFLHFANTGGQLVMNSVEVSKMLDRAVDAEHGPGSHSGHNEQNN